jgi:hypothetical protein
VLALAELGVGVGGFAEGVHDDFGVNRLGLGWRQLHEHAERIAILGYAILAQQREQRFEVSEALLSDLSVLNEGLFALDSLVDDFGAHARVSGGAPHLEHLPSTIIPQHVEHQSGEARYWAD